MKKNEVPQDKSFLEKNNMRELCYATDEDGNYTTKLSSGWDPKTAALEKALERIDRRTAEAAERVRNGISSPIEYYMERNRMDLSVLASYVGMWEWRVKRHFKPARFNKLSAKMLQKYADAFSVSVKELKNPSDIERK